MFAYDAGWTDAAVRRFIRRCGASAVDDLLDLRAADNVGSGLSPDVDGLESLRARCREQLEARVALDLAGLAVNGDDLMKALDIAAGPALGRLLDRLLELVVVDPMLNDRSRLLTIARALVAADATLRPTPPRRRAGRRRRVTAMARTGSSRHDRAAAQGRERARPRASSTRPSRSTRRHWRTTR